MDMEYKIFLTDFYYFKTRQNYLILMINQDTFQTTKISIDLLYKSRSKSYLIKFVIFQKIPHLHIT
jgi:hypothetical protein